jgi:hypothetical protein
MRKGMMIGMIQAMVGGIVTLSSFFPQHDDSRSPR